MSKVAPNSYASQEELQTALQEQLLSLSFHAFEECVQQLLVSMGYVEVKLMGRTQWRQRTAHGGLDMEAYTEVGVTRIQVIAQVKQYTRPIQRRFVDELRGTMLRTGSRHGLLVTTSTFPNAAKKAVAGDRLAPIRLIDGEELTNLLIRYQIGVISGSENNPAIDNSYFDQLRERFPGKVRGRRTKTEEAAPGSQTPVTNPIHSEVTLTQGGAMLARTHILIGLSTLWGVSLIPYGVTAENLPLLAAITILGALLPDLDAVESKIKSFSIKGVQPFALFADSANKMWGHRGFLHSLPALCLLGGGILPLAFLVGWQIPLCLWLGYASHLMADACTRTGIPGAPFTKRFFLLPYKWRVVTGSSYEEALYPFLASAAALFFLRYLIPH
ncbi:MAG: restriction endonuclease [Armatimonadetes bacterium]|nr:restriction endonuclease [Armatimonadota bacterium]